MNNQETTSSSAGKEGKRLPAGIIRRSAARLAAVQALYSKEVGGLEKDASELALDLIQFYTAPEEEGMNSNDEVEQARHTVQPDKRYLALLIRGITEKQEILDEYISSHLAEGWSLERLGPVLRAILRAGIYELLEMKDIPIKVIINEYIEVTRAFFSDEEPKFVNGVLDRVGKKVREPS